MEVNGKFEGDHLTRVTSFSELLFGDDDENAVGLHVDQTIGYSSVFPIDKTPRMLCFGDYGNEGELLLSDTNGTPQKSVITSIDSASASSYKQSSSSINSLSKYNKKRYGSGEGPVRFKDSVITGEVANQRSSKKAKAENPTSTGHAKRKEKVKERIAALQQLVSPFGKADTASVLHEAMGYIKFLHDQVQVLCSPFLQHLPSSLNPHHHNHQPGDGDNNGEEAKKDLRSRGLCLIPVDWTVHVDNSNGADFWSPAMGNGVFVMDKAGPVNKDL